MDTSYLDTRCCGLYVFADNLYIVVSRRDTMQTKFKRHQDVVLKVSPNPEYVEYHEGFEGTPLKPGMKGKINLLLTNGQYHVEIFDGKGNLVAYAPLSEEDLQAA